MSMSEKVKGWGGVIRFKEHTYKYKYRNHPVCLSIPLSKCQVQLLLNICSSIDETLHICSIQPEEVHKEVLLKYSK